MQPDDEDGRGEPGREHREVGRQQRADQRRQRPHDDSERALVQDRAEGVEPRSRPLHERRLQPRQLPAQARVDDDRKHHQDGDHPQPPPHGGDAVLLQTLPHQGGDPVVHLQRGEHQPQAEHAHDPRRGEVSSGEEQHRNHGGQEQRELRA